MVTKLATYSTICGAVSAIQAARVQVKLTEVWLDFAISLS